MKSFFKKNKFRVEWIENWSITKSGRKANIRVQADLTVEAASEYAFQLKLNGKHAIVLDTLQTGLNTIFPTNTYEIIESKVADAEYII
jgi:hypothetical protein